jgi:hypothetical protein
MNMINISRRKFLSSLAAVTAIISGVMPFAKNAVSANLAGDIGGAINSGIPSGRITLLKHVLQWQLPYVVIDQQTLEVFYRDLSRSEDRFESLLIVEQRMRDSERVLQLNKSDPYVKFYGTNLAREFLLSTSYFYDKKLRYLGVYSPYTRPCQNPFARFD